MCGPGKSSAIRKTAQRLKKISSAFVKENVEQVTGPTMRSETI